MFWRMRGAALARRPDRSCGGACCSSLKLESNGYKVYSLP
jgi:hypothetical protein